MTPEQCAEARKLLGWNRQRLGARSGTCHCTIYTFEERRGRRRGETVAAIQAALEAAGIEFGGAGTTDVNLRLPLP
ncbi:transcriptional regulator [Roseomonas sp. BN140053]|uniref:transcriptional regulator n=1 Tax=Roseomonas sp. BN140053 TaxID=3391898 RepID=UPI0039E9B6CA